jgi:uncharacterized membrane protein YebE (DUF533 family)
MTDGQAPPRALEWFYLEHFGFSKAPPLTDPEVVRHMALALVAAASGDGELSESERRWILGYCAVKGYPPAVIEEIAALSKADVDAVPELMQLGILRSSRRILLYDAIRAASVDGYHARERAFVRNVAGLLGVDDQAVAAIEALVANEEALKAQRIAILMPEGHPNLDSRYLGRA